MFFTSNPRSRKKIEEAGIKKRISLSASCSFPHGRLKKSGTFGGKLLSREIMIISWTPTKIALKAIKRKGDRKVFFFIYFPRFYIFQVHQRI